jgi:hypothetical protein
VSIVPVLGVEDFEASTDGHKNLISIDVILICYLAARTDIGARGIAAVRAWYQVVPGNAMQLILLLVEL